MIFAAYQSIRDYNHNESMKHMAEMDKKRKHWLEIMEQLEREKEQKQNKG